MSDIEKTPKIAFLGDACCGCGACAARCSKSCVSMKSDTWGFVHPTVDMLACVGCGACDSVCPVINIPEKNSEKDRSDSAFWAKAYDMDLLEHSSSGGMFGLLARDILSRGGVVVGAAWAEGCRDLRHIVAKSEFELDLISRSKYVQSSVGREVYEGIRSVLSEGRPALFAGTACQVSGMRSYLGRLASSELFLAVDVICHGVPSPELWHKWLAYVGSCRDGVVCGVNFRSKTTGWATYSVVYDVRDERGSVRHLSTPFSKDWYMSAFINNASLRPSCNACPFKRRCGSDITLGDYWGVETRHPEVSTEGGVSAVIINDGRGADAMGRIIGKMDSGPTSFDRIASGNPSLIRPSTPFKERALFMDAVREGIPIHDMMTRWSFETPLGQKLISKTKRVVKRLLGKV